MRVQFRQERSTPEAREIFGYDEKLWADAVSIRQALTEIVAMCLQSGGVELRAGAGQGVAAPLQPSPGAIVEMVDDIGEIPAVELGQLVVR